jgi:tetratricopeptide (TPR) repeat protein
MHKKIFIIICIILIVFPARGYGRLHGQARLDSLLHELPTMKQDTNLVVVLNHISYEYAQIDPVKGLNFASKALQEAKKLQWEKGIAVAYSSFTNNYISRMEMDSALHYTLMALKINEELGNNRYIAISLSGAANVYVSQTNFSKALEYQFRSLKIREELKDKELIGTCLMDIGNIYVSMEENSFKQIKYYDSALKILKETGNKGLLVTCYTNMGGGYYLLKDYTHALDCYFKAWQLAEEMGRKLQVQTVIGNIGSTYLAQGNYPLALGYSFNALSLCRETRDEPGIIYELADIGRTYLALANEGSRLKLPDSLAKVGKAAFLQKSIYYLGQSIAANTQGNNLVILYECLKNISEAYNIQGDHKKALENFKLYTKIKDSVFSQDNKIKIAQQETKRETDLKEKQIEINNLSKKDTTRRTQFLLAGISFLLLVTGVVARSNRKQKTANLRLEAEKETSDKLRSDL